MKTAQAFQSIFQGNDLAHYTWKPGEYSAIGRGIELADVERHVSGTEPGILSIPALATGLCHFAAGDCDRHLESDLPIDFAEVARKITEYHLPLIVTRSKSPKSCHIWLFFKDSDGFSAAIARELISKYMHVLGISGEIEIFPKQEKLKVNEETGELSTGSGINLPFFGQSRIAFGRDGEELNLEQFVELAHERRSFGSVLAQRELGDGLSGHRDSSKGKEYGPLTINTIRAWHVDNLKGLQEATVERNIALNRTAFFAGRAFAAKALEGSEAAIKSEILKAALACGLSEAEIESTAKSGWDSGIQEPLKIKESITNPIDIRTGLEAFTYFQENFFVVEDYGGKVLVMWQEPEPNPAFKGRTRLGHQSIEQFISRYQHLTVEEMEANKDGKESTKNVNITNYWLYSKQRRQFKTIVFAPGTELDAYILNLWKGFSVKPVPGSCRLFLEHLHNVICAKDKKLSSWFVRQLAYWVQHPGEQGYLAIVLHGGKGWGKNSLVDYYGELWGQYFLTISNAEHLVGRFNRHFMTCSVCHANESFYAGNHTQESAMKVLITDPILAIEAKGVDLIQAPNMVHLFISSNRPWIVPASVDERRFAVFNLTDEHKNDFAYFEALHHERENGGKEALLAYLLNMDLKGFNPRLAPTTPGLYQQMGQSLEGAEAFWRECLMSGVLPNMIDRNKLPLLEGDVLVKTFDLLDWCKVKHMPGNKDITTQSLGLLLHSNPQGPKPAMGFKTVRKINLVTQAYERFLSIPSLIEARKRWDTLRFPEEWGNLDVEWESVSHGFKGVNQRAA